MFESSVGPTEIATFRVTRYLCYFMVVYKILVFTEYRPTLGEVRCSHANLMISYVSHCPTHSQVSFA